MACKFYGHAANHDHQLMIPTHGNQCALVTGVHAPCRMEPNPNLDACELRDSAAATAVALFQILPATPDAESALYTDLEVNQFAGREPRPLDQVRAARILTDFRAWLVEQRKHDRTPRP